MARRLKTVNAEQAALLEKRKASLARAKKRLAKLQNEVAHLSSEVTEDVKEGFGPGWYECASNVKYRDDPTLIYVMKVKPSKDEKKPFDVQLLTVEVGKYTHRVVYMNDGVETLSSNQPFGCGIARRNEPMGHKEIAQYSPIPALQLLVKYGVTERLMKDNAPRKASRDPIFMCEVNGKWCKVVGILEDFPYFPFER